MIKLYRGITQKPVSLFDNDIKPQWLTYPQDFSDNTEIAIKSAGPNGFIIMIELQEEAAMDHYRGVYQTSHPERGIHVAHVKRYEFTHNDLKENFSHWNYSVMEIKSMIES